jgi:hypothetical protein
LARLSKKVCAPADPRVCIAQRASFAERYKFWFQIRLHRDDANGTGYSFLYRFSRRERERERGYYSLVI